MTSLPPLRSMLLMVTFMAKMWNMGRTHRVVSPSAIRSRAGWFSWGTVEETNNKKKQQKIKRRRKRKFNIKGFDKNEMVGKNEKERK